MYQKFVITQDGVLKFGKVYQHSDLLGWGEECPYGGGLWKIDEGRRACFALWSFVRLWHSRFQSSEKN